MSENCGVYERCGLTFECLQEELMVSLELLKALLVLHGGDSERQGQHSGHREECEGVPGRRSERREASGARADHNSTWGLSSGSKVQSAFVGLFQGCQVVRAKICPIELQNMPNYAPARKCPPYQRFFAFYCNFINKFSPGLDVLEIFPPKNCPRKKSSKK